MSARSKVSLFAALAWAFCAFGRAGQAANWAKEAGIQGGLAAYAGGNAAEIAPALRGGGGMVVHALCLDEEQAAKAREEAYETVEDGSLAYDVWRGPALPYSDNLINLLLIDSDAPVAEAEALRALAPGGTAFFRRGERWEKIVKPWPDDIDEWSHFLHDAGNNAVADDDRAGPPRGMQWTAGPLWLRSHEIDSSVMAMVSAQGRIFYILDQGPTGIVDERLPETWALMARDAFNGVELWQRPIELWGWPEWKKDELAGKDWTTLYGQRTKFPASLERRVAAAGDRLFVTMGYQAPVSILDAASGETLRVCEDTGGADELLFCDGALIVCARDLGSDAAKRRGLKTPEQGDRLLGVDPESGKIIWRHPAGKIATYYFAAAGGRVFYYTGNEAVCLALKTGEELWRAKAPDLGGGAFVAHGEALFLSGSKKLAALSASDGSLLWEREAKPEKGAPSEDLFIADGLVWRGLSGVGLDPLTGEEKRVVSAENLRSGPHHHRCYRNKATNRYIMSGKEGVESLDIQGDGHSRDNWVRGSCKLGVMPCNGMLYVPPDQCFCNPGVKLPGFNALNPAPAPVDESLEGRLVKGPAYDAIAALKNKPEPAKEDEWPTYRRDAARSGGSAATVAARVLPRWRAEPGGKLSPPTMAGGQLYLAQVDAGAVLALDPLTGQTRWRFLAGGRVDSPPTIYRGLALFGSRDGWVYCLRAEDGALAWRFRAAPGDRMVAAFGRVESAWPSHGSVLMVNGLAYCTAGRSSFLDGGIRLYALDPFSGALVHQGLDEGPMADLAEGPGQTFYMDGALSDILSSDGERIYMRKHQFTLALELEKTEIVSPTMGDERVGLHLFSTAGFLDDSWFNRTYWMYSARWPGFYIANQAPKTGQLLVFDDKRTYGVNAFTRRNRHSPFFFPETDGYLIFADDNDNEPILTGEPGGPEAVAWLRQNEYDSSRGTVDIAMPTFDKDKGIGFTRAKPPLWMSWVNVRARAMTLAHSGEGDGKTLFFAGPPDVLVPGDELAAFQGRAGGWLWAVSAADGETIARLQLDDAPVFDGMIAARDMLFMTTENGQILGFADPSVRTLIDPAKKAS